MGRFAKAISTIAVARLSKHLDRRTIPDFRVRTDINLPKRMCDGLESSSIPRFKTDIDFVESSVFDMLLLQKFQEYKDISAVERDLKKNYRKLINKLDFRLSYL